MRRHKKLSLIAYSLFQRLFRLVSAVITSLWFVNLRLSKKNMTKFDKINISSVRKMATSNYMASDTVDDRNLSERNCVSRLPSKALHTFTNYKLNGARMLSVTKLMFAGLLCLFVVMPVHAVILKYEGNLFTSLVLDVDPITPPEFHTLSDRVTFSLDLAAELGSSLNGHTITPISFIATDGVSILTEASSNDYNFQFWTDTDGTIINWIAAAANNNFEPGGVVQQIVTWNNRFQTVDHGRYLICGPTDPVGACYRGNASFTEASTRDNPGNWYYETVTVPAPASIWLFAAGLAGLFGFSRFKKQQRDSCHI
jgi:hypothetical protein